MSQTRFSGPVESAGGFTQNGVPITGGSSTPGYSIARFNSGGTVDFFGAAGAPTDLTITAVYVIAGAGPTLMDINNNGSLVASIAPASPGEVLGATTISNTAVTAGTQVTVDILSAGTGFAIVHFDVV